MNESNQPINKSTNQSINQSNQLKQKDQDALVTSGFTKTKLKPNQMFKSFYAHL